jgi:hypothetical protein
MTKTLTTQTKRFVAKLMVAVMLFSTTIATSAVAYAAERVLSNWGNITITRDVSEDVYLSSVFSLGGNNFVGFVEDPVSWQTYFATSNDAVNWELQSEFFNLVYGGGRFVGVNQNGLHFTDDGTSWRAANLPSNITPYSVKFENGTFKLYYRLGDESGLMLSDDAETWWDVTNDIPSNVSTRQIFSLNDRTIALGNTRTGASGMTVLYTTSINENATQWTSIESLARPGFGFFSHLIFHNGNLALHLYDMQSYTSDWTRDTSRDVYVITRDFINWEEKTWVEWNWDPDVPNPNTWFPDWAIADYYSTWLQDSTLPRPTFNVDSNRFGGLEILPYTAAGLPFPITIITTPDWRVYAWDSPQQQAYRDFNEEMRRAFNAGEWTHWMSIVTNSSDGTNWSRDAAAISLNGRQINRTAQAIPDIAAVNGSGAAPNIGTASNWAQDSINQAFELGLIPAALQNNYTANATRADFAALGVTLYETLTGSEITGRTTFADTDDINVQKLAYLEIVSGVGDNNFAPNNGLTREQAAAILSRLFDALGEPLPQANPDFTDNNLISDWAVDVVGQIQAAGVMSGMGDGSFAPQGSFTREQSIITILRIFESLN